MIRTPISDENAIVAEKTCDVAAKFIRRGVSVFLNSLERADATYVWTGADVTQEIVKAAERSTVSVVFISKDFISRIENPYWADMCGRDIKGMTTP